MNRRISENPREAVALQLVVRALCTEALKAARQYRKINPEAFQVLVNSERKGAASLARKIIKVIKRPNGKLSNEVGPKLYE